MNRILVWGLFGLGFDILFGFTGLLSFGQSAFYGTGGFVAAYLLTRAGFPNVMLALVIGMIAAAVAGYLVGLIALRRTGIYFAMITVAIAQVFYFVEFNPLADWTGGENGLPGVPTPSFNLGFTTLHFTTGWSLYQFLALCYFVGIVIALRIVRSPVGAILSAIRDNPLRAAAVGHNIHGYKLTAFVIAAAYAGICRRPARRAAGFHAARCLHLRHVRPTRDADRDRRHGARCSVRWSARPSGCSCRISCRRRSGSARPGNWCWAWSSCCWSASCAAASSAASRICSACSRGKRAEHPSTASPAPAQARRRRRAGSAPASRSGACHRRAERDRHSGPILQATGLTKRYGGLLANSDIDFTVNHGELRGIIGPNGAGKIDLLQDADLRNPPTSGKIVFEGATSPA